MSDALSSSSLPNGTVASETTRSVLLPNEVSVAAQAQEAETRMTRAYEALHQARQSPDRPLDTLGELRAELGRRLEAGKSEQWCSRAGDQDITFRLMAAGHKPPDIARGLNQSSLNAIAQPEPMYGERITAEVERGIQHSKPMQDLITDVTRNKVEMNLPNERRLDKLGLDTQVQSRANLNPARGPVTPETIAPTYGRGGAVGGGIPLEFKGINSRDDSEHLLE